MTEEQLSKIFNPFVQADTSITREYGGSGLGLAITKKLVELVGGKIHAESKVNQGSTFVVDMPVLQVGQEFVEPSEAMLCCTGDTESDWNVADLSAVKILVADDAQTNQELIQCIFSETNADITSVLNGKLAVEAIQSAACETEFDLVLMDMQMPVMDGIEATSKIRELGFEKPIIALTANKMKGDEERFLAAGCSAYVSKPIDINLLLDTVCDFVNGGAAAVSVKTIPDEVVISIARPDQLCQDQALEQHEICWQDELPDHKVMKGLAMKFIEKSVSQDIPVLTQALQTDDIETVANIAHRIKGTAGSVGFATLTEHAQVLEAQNREADKEGAEVTLAQICSYLGIGTNGKKAANEKIEVGG